ncbi:LacI family DNA-binding transcriptional regulator [Lactobacillus johnsonii]|uniref:LacI family DNA-binding transcriptional regulator n=1 Tax=Lactobacillus johnsonii TaxID=33959 RepID=UPI0028EDF133|nr:LacI family DNA-binding transcriptional regulator [Lactobacillus johnsonii]MDT9605771.1 LacI family DNA-binding transcriptional regulator [Lactobacillus johnsonii]
MTIRDIAKLANVSVATVSRIINNSGKVSEETRNKVIKIIKENNYQPNQVARTLYQKRSKMIGIIVPTIDNVFYARIINGIQSVLQPSGYTCLVYSGVGSSNTKYHKAINSFLQNNIDGIISSAFDLHENYYHIPFVMYDSANINDNIVRIVSNNIKGGTEIVDLISNNQIKKVLIQHLPLKLPTVNERVSSIIDELNKKQLNYALQEINESDTYNIGAEKALKNIQKYNAIITINDIYAAHILKLAKKRNLKVPEDFQLVGYDNNELSEFTIPTLSTIDQQPELIGKAAAKRLLKMINGEKSTKNSLIDIKVVKRESTK